MAASEHNFHDLLHRISISDLKEYAKKIRVDVSDCLEKSDLIARLHKYGDKCLTFQCISDAQLASESKVKLEPCRVCGNEANKFCAKWRIARYCSAECQKKNWKTHKLDCSTGLKPPSTARVIFVTVALDTELIFPAESIPSNGGPPADLLINQGV